MKGHLNSIRPAVDVRHITVLTEQSPCACMLHSPEQSKPLANMACERITQRLAKYEVYSYHVAQQCREAHFVQSILVHASIEFCWEVIYVDQGLFAWA